MAKKKNIPLENQKIMRKTIVLLSTIYVAYICNDGKEKEKLKKLYLQNEKKAIEASDLSNVIKEKRGENKIVLNTENIELPVVTKKSFIENLISKIIITFLETISK